MSVSEPTFLRRILAVDAVLSAAMGALMLLAVSPLSSLLSLPPSLLTWAALILLPFSAFLGWLATRELPPREGVWAVIVCNAVWVIASFGLLTVNGLEPSLLGKGFVVFQAVVVAVLGELEFFGLRRTRRLATA